MILGRSILPQQLSWIPFHSPSKGRSIKPARFTGMKVQCSASHSSISKGIFRSEDHLQLQLRYVIPVPRQRATGDGILIFGAKQGECQTQLQSQNTSFPSNNEDEDRLLMMGVRGSVLDAFQDFRDSQAKWSFDGFDEVMRVSSGRDTRHPAWDHFHFLGEITREGCKAGEVVRAVVDGLEGQQFQGRVVVRSQHDEHESRNNSHTGLEDPWEGLPGRDSEEMLRDQTRAWEWEVECRPSDAVWSAMVCSSPVYMRRCLWDQCSKPAHQIIKGDESYRIPVQCLEAGNGNSMVEMFKEGDAEVGYTGETPWRDPLCIARLKSELQIAVQEEDYKRASEIRDHPFMKLYMKAKRACDLGLSAYAVNLADELFLLMDQQEQLSLEYSELWSQIKASQPHGDYAES